MSGRIQETALSFLIIYSKQGWSNIGRGIKTQPESIFICNIVKHFGMVCPFPVHPLLSKNDAVGFAGGTKIVVSYRHGPSG